MNRLRLAGLRQKARELKGRRSTLERLAMGHHAMIAASLLERRLRPDAYPIQ